MGEGKQSMMEPAINNRQDEDDNDDEETAVFPSSNSTTKRRSLVAADDDAKHNNKVSNLLAAITSPSSHVSGGSASSDIDPLPWLFTRIPNTAFGISMGLGGHSIAWKNAAVAQWFVDVFHHASMFNDAFWFASVIVFCVVGALYIYKMIFKFDLVLKEWRCPSRTHFMNVPHLTLLMISIGMPDRIGATPRALRVLWSLTFAAQLVITNFMYEHWFFDSTTLSARRLSCAKPQFLLSTVGWFLLSVLGSTANIAEAWGLVLPAFCFGAGTVLYLMVIMNIFNDNSTVQRGSPALFLLIAPPSVAVVASDMLAGDDDSFAVISQVILGWCLIVVALLVRLGPIIFKRPPVFGVYWAYVFPSSALATALLRYASKPNTSTTSSQIFAAIVLIVAFLALVVVFSRTTYHWIKCILVKNEFWGDPLLQGDHDT